MTSYPLDCAAAFADLMQVLLRRQWAEDRARLGLAAWNLQGFAQAKLLGNPDAIVEASANGEWTSIEAIDGAIEVAEGVVGELRAVEAAGDATPKAIDPATLALILQLITQVALPALKQIGEWLRNRRKPQPAPVPPDPVA